MPDFNPLIDRLAQTATAPDAFNQFGAGDNPYNALRRANLNQYLQDVFARQPKIALITEAPGYKGMRLTGVPMLSRRMLRDGVPSLDLFGTARGYADVPEPGFERMQSEQSGTILWGTLAQLGIVPLVWGTFPFHPHLLDLALTNRAPRSEETRLGESFLREMFELFHPETIIAVGNVAHSTLTRMEIYVPKIRHPAQGGKAEFVAGLHKYLGSPLISV